MEIKIQSENDTKKIIERNRVLWLFSSRDMYRMIIVYTILGIGILVLGFSTKYTFRVASAKGWLFYNLNILITIGLAVLLFAALNFYQTQIAKKRFFLNIDRYIHRIKQLDSVILITDSGIKFVDEELVQELKWSRLSHYKIYRGFIFLIIDVDATSSFMIDQSDIPREKLSEVLDFIEKKLIPFK